MDERMTARVHKVNMVNRKNMQITGVMEVISFDVQEVLLETGAGMLHIKGEDLHVKNLNVDKGEVEVDGTVHSFSYSEVSSFKKKSESMISRMFK